MQDAASAARKPRSAGYAQAAVRTGQPHARLLAFYEAPKMGAEAWTGVGGAGCRELVLRRLEPSGRGRIERGHLGPLSPGACAPGVPAGSSGSSITS